MDSFVLAMDFYNQVSHFFYDFRILLLCHQNPDGITDALIQDDMPQFDVKQRVTAINRLLSTVCGFRIILFIYIYYIISIYHSLKFCMTIMYLLFLDWAIRIPAHGFVKVERFNKKHPKKPVYFEIKVLIAW